MHSTTEQYNIQAEEAVLGALIADNRLVVRVSTILSPTDFYAERNEWLYDAIVALYENNNKAEPITIADQLNREGKLESFGGADALSELIERTPFIGDCEEYAKVVRHHSRKRQLIQAGRKIANLGEDTSLDADEAFANAEGLLSAVVRANTPDCMTEASGAAALLLERVQAIHGGAIEPALPVSLPTLSRTLRGWMRKQQTVIAAPTGVGKTTLAVHEAASLLRHGYKVAFWSLEMPEEEITAKFIGWLTNTDWEQVYMGYGKGDSDSNQYPYRARSKQELEKRIKQGMEELRGMQIRLISAREGKDGRVIMPDQSLYGIRSQLFTLAEKSGVDFWVVDNLPLVKFSEQQLRTERRDLLGEASMRFKDMAIETNSHCFLIHQLNRAALDSKISTHDHLGESKKVADNANNVLIIDAPKRRGDDSASEEDRTINISKKRGGRTAFLKEIQMNGATGWYTDPVSRHLEQQDPNNDW